MRDLNANLIIEKNRMYSTSAMIWLVIIEVDDADTEYYAIYPEDVTFDGQTYTAIPAMRDNEVEELGRLDGLKIYVANVDKVISAYLENAADNIVGRDVTLRIVHSDFLDTAAAKYDKTYRVNSVTVGDEVATFELGQENLLAVRVPMHRYLRGRCRFRFKDTRCGYPGDEFELGTRQDFYDDRSSGSPFEKLNGWHILNPTACDRFDASVTTEGVLTIGNATGSTYQWYDTSHAGAFVFKLLTGDFDIEACLNESAFTENDVGVLFVVQSQSDETDWVAFRWLRTSGADALAALDTVSGTTTPTAVGSFHPYVRITRVGSTITWYSKAASGDSWTQQDTTTRADLLGEVRIGFASTVENAGAGSVDIEFSYFRVTTGGLTTCGYTRDDCATRGNTLRYGGCDGIPRGRIYV